MPKIVVWDDSDHDSLTKSLADAKAIGAEIWKDKSFETPWGSKEFIFRCFKNHKKEFYHRLRGGDLIVAFDGRVFIVKEVDHYRHENRENAFSEFMTKVRQPHKQNQLLDTFVDDEMPDFREDGGEVIYAPFVDRPIKGGNADG